MTIKTALLQSISETKTALVVSGTTAGVSVGKWLEYFPDIATVGIVVGIASSLVVAYFTVKKIKLEIEILNAKKIIHKNTVKNSEKTD